MKVPIANERKIIQRKQKTKKVDAFSSPGVRRCCPESNVGKLCAVFIVGRIQVKVRQQYVHIPEKNTKHLNGMDKSCQNEPENFPVPTSYNEICALYLTPSCFHDQFTADLSAKVGYRWRQLKKEAVPAVLTEKCGAAPKLKCCREIFDGLDTGRDTTGKLSMTEELGRYARSV